MANMLCGLRDAGRRDLLGLLADRRLGLTDLYEAWQLGRDELEQLKARAESPRLGQLVTEWLEWMRSPAGISPRRRRRYAPKSVRRYEVSWEGIFEVLPRGRKARLTDLTPGFLADYRRSRKRAGGGRRRIEIPDKPLGPATFNRDMAAVGAFFTWVQDVKELAVDRPRIPREREPQGRERWLSWDEIRAFERHCPGQWWPFFKVLFQTGLRVGEAQGLRWGDVSFAENRIWVHEKVRRLKTRSATRGVPVHKDLKAVLTAHMVGVPAGPRDLVFPGEFQSYDRVYDEWKKVCAAADIEEATPHDARHTFGVHAAQAGVPIPRLQKVMGHATATMTLRYMAHAPEAYLDEDLEAIVLHQSGVTDREAQARVDEARNRIRRA
jgi:integrase